MHVCRYATNKKEYINEIEDKYQLVKREGIKVNFSRSHDV